MASGNADALPGFLVESVGEAPDGEFAANSYEGQSETLSENPVVHTTSLPFPEPTVPLSLPLVLEQPVVDTPAPGRDSSSSSSSSSKSNVTGLHGVKSTDIDFDVKDDEIISHDARLSRDVDLLQTFLYKHGSSKPEFSIQISGWHHEKRTRRVMRDGKQVTETYTVQVFDFSFGINLSELVMEPEVWSLPDSVPAYRGTTTMAVEPNGPCAIERRRLVESDDADIEEAWELEKMNSGLPPWTPSKHVKNSEDGIGLELLALSSGRSIQGWLQDYIQSRRIVKDFKWTKSVYGWNRVALEQSVESLIQSTGYKNSISIRFEQSSRCVHVRSPNMISRIFSSGWLIFLTCILLVFPFLWLWKRYWPGASGKWEVLGSAFPLKKWQLLDGTHQGETIEAARLRMGDSLRLSEEEEAIRLQVGPRGVNILKGKREVDWFKEWEWSIREAVRNKIRVQWLDKKELATENHAVSAIANHLNQL